MFDFLPKELNSYIYRFFNKQALISVSQVSRFGKKIAEDEQLLLQLLGLDHEHLPEYFSAKEIYQIYYDLFKLPGNNFCNLIKNNKLSFGELQQSLQLIIDKGISVGYVYSDQTISPPMILCPLKFQFRNEQQCISVIQGYLLSGTELPSDIQDLKMEYSYLEFLSVTCELSGTSNMNKLIQQDVNCIVVFSKNKNIIAFEETCKKIKEEFIKNNRPVPFIISTSNHSYKTFSDDKKEETIKFIKNLPAETVKAIEEVGIDNFINFMIKESSIPESGLDDVAQQINDLSLPITNILCESTDIGDSLFWPKLTEAINSIVKTTLKLEAAETVSKKFTIQSQ